jgi:hypothetical protein
MELTHCVSSLMDSRGVTVFFSAESLSEEERTDFELSGYPRDLDDNDEPRSMISFAFCAGQPGAAPDATAISAIEVAVNDEESELASRQWVLQTGAAEIVIETLEGKLEPGARLAGHFTGKPEDDYSFDVTFDVVLPTNEAVSGPGCDD